MANNVFGLYIHTKQLEEINQLGLKFENGIKADDTFVDIIQSCNLFTTSIYSITNDNIDFIEYCKLMEVGNSIGFIYKNNYSFFLVPYFPTSYIIFI